MIVISKTPVRMSFAGGGSDLRAFYQHRPGAVVSATFDKHIYVTVSKRFDDLIRVAYSKSELVEQVDQVEHGIIRSALQRVGLNKGIEIVYVGDLPLGTAGTGLGASSGIAVGVLNALYAFKGERVTPERLAREACQIEIDVLKRPIGKQDQYAAAYGGFNHFEFMESEHVSVEPLYLSHEMTEALNSELLLFYTGMATESTSVLAAQQEATPTNLGNIDEMVRLARALPDVLRKGDFAGFGRILNENWLLKRKLATRISNDVIDRFYTQATAAGATGGKILGSGGGGFLLFHCPIKFQENVKDALGSLRFTPFRFVNTGSQIIYTEVPR